MSAWDSYIFDNVEPDDYPYDDGDTRDRKDEENSIDEVIPF